MTIELETALRETAEQVTLAPLNLDRILAAAGTRRRRRTAVAGATALALASVSGLALTQPWSSGEGDTSSVTANAPSLAGVQQFTDLAHNHVAGPVTYPQDPPVGGDHNPLPQTCGVYTQPIPNTSAVHSLEHGAVWITYGSNVPADQVKMLDQNAVPADRVLVSPYPSLGSKITLQAWGLQLAVTDANDPRISEFVRTYANGPQTREPGGACVGSSKTVADPHDATPQQ